LEKVASSAMAAEAHQRVLLYSVITL